MKAKANRKVKVKLASPSAACVPGRTVQVTRKGKTLGTFTTNALGKVKFQAAASLVGKKVTVTATENANCLGVSGTVEIEN